eukprot:1147941-Pelagomonas_calceolata.AAC.7
MSWNNKRRGTHLNQAARYSGAGSPSAGTRGKTATTPNLTGDRGSIRGPRLKQNASSCRHVGRESVPMILFKQVCA